MQTLKNKAFRVSIQWNALVRKLLALARGAFTEKLAYKCALVGITLHTTEERFTSKCDHLANEPMQHHEQYLGKRVKRGLFKSSIGKSLNADINGAIGILRKVFPDAVKTLRDSGVVFTPVKISLAF